MEERVRSEVVVLLLVVLVAEAVCVADQRKAISAFGRHGFVHECFPAFLRFLAGNSFLACVIQF